MEKQIRKDSEDITGDTSIKNQNGKSSFTNAAKRTSMTGSQ